MNFQLKQIKEAHSKVKSGADFPNYVQDLLRLGVKKYDTFVTDGHQLFFGDNNYQIESNPSYAALAISDKGDKEKFRQYLKIHQQGQTDYLTFCHHAAETGIVKWTVDMSEMTCTYYNQLNEKILEEQIPALS